MISDYNKNILINSTVDVIKQYFPMSIPENMKVLPTLFCKKMHKSSIGTRFIIACNQFVTKPLSKKIAAAFKLLYKYVENHNKGMFLSLRLLSLFNVSIVGLLFGFTQNELTPK